MIDRIMSDLPFLLLTIVLWTLITAILTVSGKQLVERIRLFMRLRKGKYKNFEGNWYIYIYIISDSKELVRNEIQCNFKLALTKQWQYKVEELKSIFYYQDDNSEKSLDITELYQGELGFDYYYMNILLHRREDPNQDDTLLKFWKKDMVEPGKEIYYGVYVSTTYGEMPCCGISILSKNSLTQVELDAHIMLKYTCLPYVTYLDCKTSEL